MTDQLVIDFDTRRNFKRAGTSSDAAAAIAPRAGTIRYRILTALAEHGPMTPDTCAARIGNGILGVRPRFSELRAAGFIKQTDRKRPNLSGLNADEYEISETGREYLTSEKRRG